MFSLFTVTGRGEGKDTLALPLDHIAEGIAAPIRAPGRGFAFVRTSMVPYDVPPGERIEWLLHRMGAEQRDWAPEEDRLLLHRHTPRRLR